ncbi:hypothetical protein ACFQ0M_03110 [Kitasatospora aburaviensis]
MALLAGLGSALTAQGLTWWRTGPQGLPFGVAVYTAFFAFLVGLFLLLTQWPLAVTLGLPVVGWLGVTAASVAGSLEDA